RGRRRLRDRDRRAGRRVAREARRDRVDRDRHRGRGGRPPLPFPRRKGRDPRAHRTGRPRAPLATPRTGGAPMTTTGTLERNHGTFEGVGRLRLQYRSWEVSAPKAAVVFVHGFSDHSGRYESFAETLATFGVSTFAFDLRGHGQSDGRRGYVRRFEIYLQELDHFRQEVQGLVAGDCPLFLVGHSMGGLIALRYLEEFESPFRDGIIVSPWLGTAMYVPRWKVVLATFLNRMLP